MGVGFENRREPRIGRALIAQHDAKYHCTCFASGAIPIAEHCVEEAIKSKGSLIGRESLKRQGAVVRVSVLHLDSFTGAVEVDGREIVESIVIEELLVAPSFNDASK
jgi:hypothetical protein